MSAPTPTPVSPAVSKRLVTLIAAVLVTQLRRLGLEPDDMALLYEVVDLILVSGVGAHWLVPVLRKSVAKAKVDTTKAETPVVSDAEDRP